MKFKKIVPKHKSNELQNNGMKPKKNKKKYIKRKKKLKNQIKIA